jgi:hypothetical protein
MKHPNATSSISLISFLLVSTCTSAAIFEPISGVEDPLIWGTQANRGVFTCSISGDGLVVGFETDATQLVANDRNGLPDIFVRTATGTQKVSRRAAGGDARDFSTKPSLSTTGRYVAFRSSDDLLGDATAVSNTAYWVDRQTNTFKRASFTLSGTPVPVTSVAISGNGRYVTFDTAVSNLVAVDTNADSDVFRFDSQTGLIELVSAGPFGTIGNSDSQAPSIDETGNLIAFDSLANNLVVGDPGINDVFVKNLSTGVVLRASQDNAGVGGNQSSRNAYIAANGNFVVFETSSSNLDSATPDGNGFRDIYRHNLTSRNTERVSVSANSGPDANNSSFDASISANGRYVWFGSSSSDLVVPAPVVLGQLYRRDMSNSVVVMASNNALSPGLHQSSTDGQSACFATSSALQPDDTNRLADVYRVDLSSNAFVRQSVSTTAIASAFSSQDVLLSDASADATRVLAIGAGNDLDAQSFAEIVVPSGFLADIVPSTGQTTLLARNSTGALPDRSTRSTSCSERCVFVAVETEATNLSAFDTNGSNDVYRLQTEGAAAGTLTLVSQALDGSAAGADSGSQVSGSGGFDIAFLSLANNIVAGDTNGYVDAFLWRSTGVPITRVSVSSAGAQADGDTTELSIDENGTIVVLTSVATNLVASDSNGVSDVFVYQRSNASTIRVSAEVSGLQLADPASSPSISADSRLVLYFVDRSSSDDELHLYDRILQTRRKIVMPVGVVPVKGTAKFASNPRYFGFVGREGDQTIAYRFDLESSSPLRELSRTSDALFGVTAIGEVLITAANNALINTTQPLSDADRNARFDIQKVTLETGNASFPVATVTVPESAGTIDIPVRRLLGSEARVEVNGTFTTSTAQPEDFLVVQGRAVWEDNINGVQNLRITIVDDALPEGPEAFQVQLVPSGGVGLGTQSTLTINITDNDTDQLFKSGFE